MCRACVRDPRSHYMHLCGYAADGRPIIYSCLANPTNKVFEDNKAHMIQTFEWVSVCLDDEGRAWRATDWLAGKRDMAGVAGVRCWIEWLRKNATRVAQHCAALPFFPVAGTYLACLPSLPSLPSLLPRIARQAIKCMPPGVEQWIWVCDFKGFGMADVNPKLAKVGRQWPQWPSLRSCRMGVCVSWWWWHAVLSQPHSVLFLPSLFPSAALLFTLSHPLLQPVPPSPSLTMLPPHPLTLSCSWTSAPNTIRSGWACS